MVASTGSLIVGGVYGSLAVIGLILNGTVILTIYKGGLLGGKASPVYILSTQTMAMDILMFLVHLVYQTPSVILQRDTTPPIVDAICDFLLMYCWFHNSLSHILITLNRLFVIVFKRADLFTRKRTFVLSSVQNMMAAALSASTAFLTPCCRISFSWTFFSYEYMTVPGVPNYSAMFTIPLETASSLISMLSYAAIVFTVHKSRKVALQLSKEKNRRNREYSYAIQFAIMVMVYSLVWIFFNTFPILIGETKFIYIYGVTTLLVLINAFANAVVYLVNNKEIQGSIRVMLGWSSIRTVSTSKTENPRDSTK